MTVELPHFTLPFRFTDVIREPSYRDTILGDGPRGYWRLGEKPGATVAGDELGNLPGVYTGSVIPNIVPNPSFEVDMTGWVGNASTVVNRVTTKFYSGVASAYLTRTPPAGTYSECSMLRATANPIPVVGGMTYTASAFIWQESQLPPQLPWLTFIWYDAAMVQITQKTITNPVVLNAWKRLIATTDAPANAAFVRIGVGLYSGNIGDGATVISGWVDGVQLTPTPAAVIYSDTQGVVLGVPGALPADADTAVAFDSGYVSVPYDPALYSPEFSLECWVKVNRRAAHQGTMFDSWGGNGYLLRQETTGAIQFYVHFANVSASYTNLAAPADTLQDGVTHHVVGTFDGQYRRIYVDGVQVATDTKPTVYWVNQSGRLGLAGSYSYVTGTMDEAAIYSYALSPETIATHHARGLRTVIPVIGAARAAEVAEQESVSEIASCCEAVIRTVQGQRTTMPEFGRPQFEFNSDPAFVRTAIAGALTEFEPRVESLVSAAPDPSDVEIQTVRALIAPRDAEEGEVT